MGIVRAYQWLPAEGTQYLLKYSLHWLTSLWPKTELLDRFGTASVPEDVQPFDTSEDVPVHVGIKAATFSWSEKGVVMDVSNQSRGFTLRIPGELIFERGTFNLVVGPTGSGKTSLLMALLGK